MRILVVVSTVLVGWLHIIFRAPGSFQLPALPFLRVLLPYSCSPGGHKIAAPPPASHILGRKKRKVKRSFQVRHLATFTYDWISCPTLIAKRLGTMVLFSWAYCFLEQIAVLWVTKEEKEGVNYQYCLNAWPPFSVYKVQPHSSEYISSLEHSCSFIFEPVNLKFWKCCIF